MSVDWTSIEWAKWSNLQLAELYGATPQLVNYHRKRLAPETVANRGVPRVQWGDADLSGTLREAAARTGRSYYAVWCERKRRGHVPKPHAPIDWANVDWSKSNAQLGRELGLSRERVRQKRNDLVD